MEKNKVPIVDVAPLVQGNKDLSQVGEALQRACCEYGFFYIVGHGVDEDLQRRLEAESQRFFSLDHAEKMTIRMELGGKAWRGYFPVGDELTSGKPDMKEGLYFGTELAEQDPRVQEGLAMHGRNLFPAQVPELKKTVLQYLAALTNLGHHLMRGLSVSLGLAPDYFRQTYTYDPLTLFRIFHYPASTPQTMEQALWGVGEHTDYGVLTILKQDEVGGLQIRTRDQWIDAPYIEGSFICNIGDMLDRMTQGYYRSTPHRVLNTSGKSRYSYPFFFDPSFDAEIQALDLPESKRSADEQVQRWDGANVHAFSGTYGEYVLGKVSKVFPQLKSELGNS